MNQISRQRRQSITLKFGKAIFEVDVLPFCVSCFFQTSPERGKEAIREGIGHSNVEKSDCRDCGLLRACHERPSCPYTERRDELPPPHGLSPPCRGPHPSISLGERRGCASRRSARPPRRWVISRHLASPSGCPLYPL